jgi:sulfur-carrier protein
MIPARTKRSPAATLILSPMATLVFTQQLRRFTEVPEINTPAVDLRAALDDAFAANPRLRGYILDEQGHLRKNVAIFIDGRRIRDHVSLNDPLSPGSNVHVLQALSGG